MSVWGLTTTTNPPKTLPFYSVDKQNKPLKIIEFKRLKWDTFELTFEDGDTQKMRVCTLFCLYTEHGSALTPSLDIDNIENPEVVEIGISYFDYGEEVQQLLKATHSDGFRGKEIWREFDRRALLLGWNVS